MSDIGRFIQMYSCICTPQNIFGDSWEDICWTACFSIEWTRSHNGWYQCL